MRNRLLVILIIIAAIFPFATTGVELVKQDQMALVALVGMSLVALAVTGAAMAYRPKRTDATETPVQAIPTIKQAGPSAEAGANPSPVRADPSAKSPASQPSAAKKPEAKRQRVR